MRKILIAVLILGSVLRIAWLGTIQSGFFRDEAAIAYNALSVWSTGADEFGMKYPLVFRSFEVFFLPLYIYVSSPIVGALGATVFASRILSALSGVLALYIVYLISSRVWSKRIGLIAAFILAVSPWHIFYSRGTFEGNLALTLFMAGFYFWIRFIDKYQTKYFLFSGVFFSLSMYSYQAERLVVPVFGLAALVVSFKEIWKIRLKLLPAIVVCLIMLIPLLTLTFKAGGYHRAFGVSIFSKPGVPSGFVENEKPSFFINNTNFLRFKEISSLYFSYFSPRNLFVEGDYNNQRSVVGVSVFYPFWIIGLLAGLFSLLKNRSTSEKLVVFWILAAPLPAALTGDPFHTYRSLLLYVPLVLVISYGFELLIKDNIKYWFVFFAFSLLFLANFVYSYVFLNQAARAHDWDYGYKQMVDFVVNLPKDTKVVIDDPWTEAYIHYLYFGNVDPKTYQSEVLKLGDPNTYYYTNPNQVRPEKIGNVEFRKIDWPSERGNTGNVFVMWAELLPDSEFKTDPKVKLLKEIFYPDGKIAFKIVKIL